MSAFGVDFNVFNSDGQNAFHVACDNNKAKIVRVSSFAGFDFCDSDGASDPVKPTYYETALIW